MKRILLLLLFFWFPLVTVLAQAPVPLKYDKEIPKNLYSARNAVLISYVTNKTITPEEEDKTVQEITRKLKADNKQIGMQLVHFANKNAFQQPALRTRLLKHYDSLKVTNLFMLDVSEFKDQGAEGSYILLLTPFNHTAKLMTENQKAFTMQAETYELLIRNLRAEIDQYRPAHFSSPPPVTAKPAAATNAIPAKSKKADQPYKFPVVSLSEEDAKRKYGGAHSNFSYYVGTNLEERNAGFFAQKLRNDIEASPDAIKELNKYRTKKYLYLAERGLFVTSLVLYANEVQKHDERVYFNDKQKVYIGMAVGSLLINHWLSRVTNKHIFRAIDEYNAYATMKNNTGMRWIKPANFSLGYLPGAVPSAGFGLSWNIR